MTDANDLAGTTPATPIDVVVVAYRSAETLRGCVEPLTAMPHVHVTVVDNASPDDGIATIADLPVDVVRAPRNGGFSYGCNLGAARGRAPFVLFLNPDARLGAAALAHLRTALEAHPRAGLVGPRIIEPGDELAWSLRTFPRPRSTFAQALFLHRIWPAARWTDELIRDVDAYARPRSVEWLSGACMLVRRSALEAVGGWDEAFFLYCEDTDLCRRIWDAGLEVRFEPAAEVFHVGGASSEAGATRPFLVRSRAVYARKHYRPAAARLEVLGVALGEATHAIASLCRPTAVR